MSLPVFPSTDPFAPGVRGLAWPVERDTEWSNLTQVVTSGKEFRTSFWTNPRYHWQISYSYLKDYPYDLWQQNVDTDLRTVEGFYDQMQGGFAPFWFWDPHDNTVQGQVIGTGNASTTAFQMVRTYGGYTGPIQVPFGNPELNIYLAGVLQSSGYSIGSTGILTFTTPPGNGVVISADFSYYFVARFADDLLKFSEFAFELWELKDTRITSLKL